jgi:poly(beta-D-mannuronate) lyase
MFLKILFLHCSLLASLIASAETIVVKNQQELATANSRVKPGDIVILQNGEWKNVLLSLNCNGTKELPITFKAQTAGKVLITGNSKLKIGGSYIVVDGLYFLNGYAGAESVITFRNNADQIANNCRVTNTVINDFNNPKRLNENYWVSLYGKNNRLDHCSFFNKKNIGVLLAVILDDDRSRENFHLIDHNYFGFRTPLASNAGEMIRVGVSEHCQFNSNTQIVDNYFEHCDGETEIISIKSCRNTIRNNLFKECQGSVVLRHGDYNTVESNVFLGNNKEGTGGVRIINKGQWVVNNLFYKCRGEGFRSPLSIMNGVPNSPANRYVAVTEALVANNSFVESTPIGFGIGSDKERSVPPNDVQFLNNVFYNKSDSLIYNVYDSINGINFFGNQYSSFVKQTAGSGFKKTDLVTTKVSTIGLPLSGTESKNNVFDSLTSESKTRLRKPISLIPGFADEKLFIAIESNSKKDCGVKWFTKPALVNIKRVVNCNTAESVVALLKKNDRSKLTINLTGSMYNFKELVFIQQDVTFTSNLKTPIKFTYNNPSFLVEVKAGNLFTIKNVNLDLSEVNDFITTDTSGSYNHSSFKFSNSSFSNLSGSFFTAAKSSVADSIVIARCTFNNNKGLLFNFTNEVTNRGYYNVEILKIDNNKFLNGSGQILDMLRGGTDESTMGPYLIFSNNRVENYVSAKANVLIHLFGTQRSMLEKNNFKNCNPLKTLIQYEDLVRAVHLIKNNSISSSGTIISNKFVSSTNNRIQQ